MDITPDGQHLVVATSGPGTGVHMGKFNLETGIDEGFNYTIDPSRAGGGYEIKITGPDTALMTTLSDGDLQEVRLSAGAVTRRTDAPGGGLGGRSGIFPSGDGNTMFIWEGNRSGGRCYIYDRLNDTFSLPSFLNYSFSAGASVNRSGDLIATPGGGPNLLIRDRNLNVVQALGASFDGAQFDPVRDIVYALSVATDEIQAFETNTWTELYRFDIGEPLNDSRYFQEGHMSISPDGNLLFINTASGVRVYSVPEPSSAGLLAAMLLVAGGSRGARFKVLQQREARMSTREQSSAAR